MPRYVGLITKSIPSECIYDLPELRAQDGTLLADGCGIITASTAKLVADQLGLKSVPSGVFTLKSRQLDPVSQCPCPSAFQIRLGGIKGMLAVYPDIILRDRLNIRNNRIKVLVRPSMRKVISDLEQLEVVHCSRRVGCASLNKMFILVFLACGIPLEV